MGGDAGAAARWGPGPRCAGSRSWSSSSIPKVPSTATFGPYASYVSGRWPGISGRWPGGARRSGRRARWGSGGRGPCSAIPHAQPAHGRSLRIRRARSISGRPPPTQPSHGRIPASRGAAGQHQIAGLATPRGAVTTTCSCCEMPARGLSFASSAPAPLRLSRLGEPEARPGGWPSRRRLDGGGLRAHLRCHRRAEVDGAPPTTGFDFSWRQGVFRSEASSALFKREYANSLRICKGRSTIALAPFGNSSTGK